MAREMVCEGTVQLTQRWQRRELSGKLRRPLSGTSTCGRGTGKKGYRMAGHESLDELLSRHAAVFADQVREAAKHVGYALA